MNILITIFFSVLILSILIIVHELGHFWMAKRAGIKVEEFGLGLPPRLWGKKKGETVYSINWIPFGGYVRMFGEDSTDKKLLKSKRSFVGKSTRDRFKVIVGGVVMNFLFAWFLFSIAMTVGMRPLILPGDLSGMVSDGTIVLETGLRIKDVKDEALDSGFMAGDLIYAVNGGELNDYAFDFLNEEMEEKEADDKAINLEKSDQSFMSEYMLHRNGEDVLVNFDGNLFDDNSGIVLAEASVFPRLKFVELEKFSKEYKAGFRIGDVIVQVNSVEIFSVDDLTNVIEKNEKLNYLISRDSELLHIEMDGNVQNGIIIKNVIDDGNAEMVGLLDGDIIKAVDGENISSIYQFSDLMKEKFDNSASKISFLIERKGIESIYDVELDENGKIGIVMSDLLRMGQGDAITFSESALISSFVSVKDVKYPFYQAPVEALKTSSNLAASTAVMLVDVVKSIFGGSGVPEGVSGPVGIVRMTSVFVHEGFIPVLQFMALLSLSLAVLNILPFPGLDGGRLFFILIEIVFNKRVNQKLETYFHIFGYLMLLAFILFITYNDIAALF